MNANNLALAIKAHEAGQLAEAEKLYIDVLKTQPDNIAALSNLGLIANQARNYPAALNLLSKTLKLKPDHSPALNIMGSTLAGLGRSSEAVEYYKQAISFQPNFIEARYNLGVELVKLEQFDEAVSALNKIISLNPNFVSAYNAIATAFSKQGKTQQAIDALQKAILLKSDFFLAHNNLGNIFMDMNHLDKALFHYEQALKSNRAFAETIFNYGLALDKANQTEQAIKTFKKALEANPEWPEARFHLTKILQHACDWSDERASADDYKSYFNKYPGMVDPFFLLSQNSTAEEQYICATNYAKRFAVTNHFTHKKAGSKSKLRIGYISGNFHSHPNSFLSVGMFEHHNRDKFEVFGYSYGLNDNSNIRQRVEKSFDNFIDLSTLSHAEAAQKIYDDKIDILIDRQGYTAGHRMQIMVYRPAPIQVNYLGYPGTMGADYIDYIIVDPFVVPLDQQPYFTEKLIHLPDCYQSTDNRQAILSKLPSRTEFGLPENAFVFCCFNNNHKIQPEIFDIWMRLLKQVPNSVLWLLGKNKLAENNLKREANARGINPERLIFVEPIERASHLARQQLADLFLDTLPYNAHTTASDALWAGLPVLTCSGNTFAGRVAGSILHAIGLPELSTNSTAEYESLALRLALEPELLKTIKQKLAKNLLSAPLFDTALYTRNIENAYMQIYGNCYF